MKAYVLPVGEGATNEELIYLMAFLKVLRREEGDGLVAVVTIDGFDEDPRDLRRRPVERRAHRLNTDTDRLPMDDDARTEPKPFAVWHRAPKAGKARRPWRIAATGDTREAAATAMYDLMGSRGGDWCVAPADTPPRAAR